MAKLSALRLLRELPEWPAPRLRCVCFATPAVGNSALAELVTNAGWSHHFRSYYLPGEYIHLVGMEIGGCGANGALAELVINAGWSHHFRTYYLPGE